MRLSWVQLIIVKMGHSLSRRPFAVLQPAKVCTGTADRTILEGARCPRSISLRLWGPLILFNFPNWHLTFNTVLRRSQTTFPTLVLVVSLQRFKCSLIYSLNSILPWTFAPQSSCHFSTLLCFSGPSHSPLFLSILTTPAHMRLSLPINP